MTSLRALRFFTLVILSAVNVDYCCDQDKSIFFCDAMHLALFIWDFMQHSMLAIGSTSRSSIGKAAKPPAAATRLCW